MSNRSRSEYQTLDQSDSMLKFMLASQHAHLKVSLRLDNLSSTVIILSMSAKL